MNNSTKNILILSLTPYFGSSRFRTAIDNHIDLDDLFTNPNYYKKQLFLRKETLDFLTEKKYLPHLDKANEWLNNSYHHLITYLDENYPSSLTNIADFPLVLYCIGDVKLLNTSQLAIVGSRNHTTYGENVTCKLISELATSNITITSGLAYGIDTLAHKYALENNLKTIAVVGTGIDVVYPSSNTSLYKKISNQGLIISEFNFGTGPLKHNFPRRNRIISGLSKGVLIIEAAKKSGSLITAAFALEQNKDIFAIPGNIFSKSSSGCNELIKQGAKLVINANDILEELGIDHNLEITEDGHNTNPNISSEQKMIFESIDSNLTTIDQIINSSHMPYNQVSEILFELEMKSFIKKVPGGYSR